MRRKSPSAKQVSLLPKGLKRRKMHKKIKINLSNTRYPIISDMSKELNFQLSYEKNNFDWDIFWTDSAISRTFFSSMQNDQKVNHFSGMNNLSRKANLTHNIKRMQKQYPESYSFIPKTFVLPEDIFLLSKFQDRMRLEGKKPTFIIKPEAGCQGKGIYLWQDKIEIQAKKEIIQVYLQYPLLYKGLKFDLRVYVLVTSCSPLRMYIFNEGLVRFATETYQRPNSRNIQQLRMHLTNYAINRESPKYIYNDSFDDLCKGHKKSLAQFFQKLSKVGLPASDYWSDIKDIAIKTVIAGLPWLRRQYELGQPQNVEGNMCFQILGFDYLIEQTDKVYLLQVNHTPSFLTDTPLDYLVKSHLIKDTLELVSRQKKIRQNSFQAKFGNRNSKRQQNRSSDVTFSVGRQTNYQQETQQFNFVEQNYLGSFERIYPCEDSKQLQTYKNFIHYSLNSIQLDKELYRIRKTSLPSTIKRKSNSQTRELNSSEFITSPVKSKLKISRILEADQSGLSRDTNNVFDRDSFRKEISRRNNQYSRRINQQSEQQYLYNDDQVKTSDLNDIIIHQINKKQGKKYRNRHVD